MQQRVRGSESGLRRHRKARLSKPSAWLCAYVAQHGATVGARFADYYEDLQRLPRYLRRALQRQWRYSLAGIAFVLALGVGPAQATVMCNPTVSCGDVEGLITAINNANSEPDDEVEGDCPGANTITLGPGANCTFTLTEVGSYSSGPNGLPSISSEIIIVGNGSTITRSTVTGTPDFRIFRVRHNGNLTLQNLTLSNGIAPTAEGSYSGGGVLNNGILTLDHCTISGNSAAGDGGGVSNTGTLMVTNTSIISGNRASYNGGGVYNDDTLTVTDSTISGNSAAGDGGGVYNEGYAGIEGFFPSTVTLTNSTISNNTASYGGGVFNSDPSTVTLTNSLLLSNSATSRGGGVSNYGTVALTNSTITGNSAPLGGESLTIKGRWQRLPARSPATEPILVAGSLIIAEA